MGDLMKRSVRRAQDPFLPILVASGDMAGPSRDWDGEPGWEGQDASQSEAPTAGQFQSCHQLVLHQPCPAYGAQPL
jgi:hypothetical protein